MTSDMDETGISASPICRLRDLGQSVWLDDIDRPMLEGGELEQLIAEDCVSGLTSNPAIFERALRTSDAYDDEIARLTASGTTVETIYERIVIEDIRRAADLFAPLYRASAGKDGYVSLEVSPHLARDTDATIAEAERLWHTLDRPNAMIKVPGTAEGLRAIRTLISKGINVNITLLFSPLRYREVAEAWLRGLEQRDRSAPIAHSVASFFLSRIDTLVDGRLDAAGNDAARDLRGETALTLARIAYADFAAMTATPRWQAFAGSGVAPQRLLWASIGTKDAAYSDVKYIEPLIGADTVTTVPGKTLDAFRDHGKAAATLSGDSADRSFDDLAGALAAAGIDLPAALAQLEEDGIGIFIDAYEKLLASLRSKVEALA